jgi:transmembrane sensor
MKQDNEQIDALISKYLLGEASPEEAMQLDDWRSTSQENEAVFQESAHFFGWKERGASTDLAWEKIKPQLRKESSIVSLYKRTGFRVAAGITLLLSVGLIWFILAGNPEQTQQSFIAASRPKTVKLSDGTAIRIADHSTVTLKKGYGRSHRYLSLKGSGYFTVKHDDKKPFVIDAGPLRIKDLGTKFDVTQTDDTIFVRVDEGKVMLFDHSGLKITLNASQSAYYVISTGELELEIETKVPNAYGKTFVFDKQRLETVIARLNLVYGSDVRIASSTAKDCLITVQFKDESLELVLDIIAETLSMKVEKEGSVYWLKGESCKE